MYVLDVFAPTVVASDVERLRSELDLGIQLAGVGVEEPDGYPGRFVEVTNEELTDPASVVLRALPAVDIVSVSAGVTTPGVVPGVLDASGAEEHLVNPVEGMLESLVRGMLHDTGAGHDTGSVGRTERPGVDGQRMLSHFDPGVVVDDEVTLTVDGGSDGQASLAGLGAGSIRTDGGSE